MKQMRPLGDVIAGVKVKSGGVVEGMGAKLALALDGQGLYVSLAPGTGSADGRPGYGHVGREDLETGAAWARTREHMGP